MLRGGRERLEGPSSRVVLPLPSVLGMSIDDRHKEDWVTEASIPGGNILGGVHRQGNSLSGTVVSLSIRQGERLTELLQGEPEEWTD